MTTTHIIQKILNFFLFYFFSMNRLGIQHQCCSCLQPIIFML